MIKLTNKEMVLLPLLGIILICSVLLSWVIELSLFQGIVIVLFMGSVWVTGRRVRDGREAN